MTTADFEKLLRTKAKELEQYANTKFAATAGNIALRFIDGNFRAQGYQGTSFRPWKKTGNGTTLVKSGTLKNATYYTSQPGQVTLINQMAYAKVHNEGFKGLVSIKGHSRNRYSKNKVASGGLTKKGAQRMKTITQKSGESVVKSHMRNMNIPQRQFMPINGYDSPVLNKAIERQISRDIQLILTR